VGDRDTSSGSQPLALMTPMNPGQILTLDFNVVCLLSGQIERVAGRRVVYNYLTGNSSKETVCKL
jgi:hypothetical protein